jgi:hypothetical protein
MFLVDGSCWRVSISFARVILLFSLEYMKYPYSLYGLYKSLLLIIFDSGRCLLFIQFAVLSDWQKSMNCVISGGD